MVKDMLGVLVRKIVDLPLEMLGAICDLVEKLLSEAGQEWLAELKKFLRKEKCWTGVAKNSFLKLISGGESLVLDAVDGTEILADAKNVFVYINSDFKNLSADEKGPATQETPVAIYEMCGDANFVQMFGELDVDIKKLCLTQHQVINFVRKFPNWLRKDDYVTFFLFESNGNFFVACMHSYSSGRLGVDASHFEYSSVWYAEYRHRVVVPQLA